MLVIVVDLEIVAEHQSSWSIMVANASVLGDCVGFENCICRVCTKTEVDRPKSVPNDLKY
jgi:hypothetical protein